MPTVLIKLIIDYLGSLLEILHKPLFEKRYQMMRTPKLHEWPKPALTIIQEALS